MYALKKIMAFTEEFTKLRTSHRIVSISSILNFTQIAHDVRSAIRFFSTAGLSLSRFYEPGACSTVFFFL